MKKIFRPLWSYDVQKTEQWLSHMAENGLSFERLNRWTRCFYFQEREPEPRIYRIAYDKMKSPVLPKTLQAEGWEKTATAGKWEFTANSQPETEIKTSPVREGIIKHNRLIMYIFFGIIFYVAGMLLMNISMVVSSWRQDGSIQVVESPLWILTYIFFGLLLATTVLGIYSIFKITKTNKELEGTEAAVISSNSELRNKLEEKELKRSGRWVTKVKIGWMSSPDKMEQWLESMEQRGYNLYRVNKIGTIFHFIKGEPRLIAYRLDYQSGPTQSYFAIHREAGWKEMFNSYSSIEKWTIWSKEYTKGEERPQLYSDQTTRLKHAKRIAITYTALFFPLMAMYVYNISVTSRSGSISEWFSWNLTGMSILFLIVFGTFVYRVWAYYIRLRKQTMSWGN